jgi:hypothetical protein
MSTIELQPDGIARFYVEMSQGIGPTATNERETGALAAIMVMWEAFSGRIGLDPPTSVAEHMRRFDLYRKEAEHVLATGETLRTTVDIPD